MVSCAFWGLIVQDMRRCGALPTVQDGYPFPLLSLSVGKRWVNVSILRPCR
jgi:hypothetical protein